MNDVLAVIYNLLFSALLAFFLLYTLDKMLLAALRAKLAKSMIALLGILSVFFCAFLGLGITLISTSAYVQGLFRIEVYALRLWLAAFAIGNLFLIRKFLQKIAQMENGKP